MIAFRSLNLVKSTAHERLDIARQLNLTINPASSYALILGSRNTIHEFTLGISNFAHLDDYVLSGQYLVGESDLANVLTQGNRREIELCVHVISPKVIEVFNQAMTVKKMLGFLLRQRGGELPESLGEHLNFVHLDETVIDSRLHALSMSEKVKLLLLLAILTQAKFMIFEELEVHLDDVELDEVMRVIRQYQVHSGASCLFLTTDFIWGLKQCDSIGVMQAGLLLESGSCSELERKALQPITLAMQQGLFSSSYAPIGCPYVGNCRAKSRVSENLCATTLPLAVSITDTHMVRCHLSADERSAFRNEVMHGIADV